jgi:tRNA threonylcarbamoyladenosine biosynthesis protein TsaE
MYSIYEDAVQKIQACKNPERATVVFLHGDLGAGKTTFTKNLTNYLNLDLDITSPTFTILKSYDFAALGFKKLIHIDAYRLSSYTELLKIKFDEYLKDTNNLIFIEWPSLVADENLAADIEMRFEHGADSDTRIISID